MSQRPALPSRGAWAGAHLPTLFHHRLVHDANDPLPMMCSFSKIHCSASSARPELPLPEPAQRSGQAGRRLATALHPSPNSPAPRHDAADSPRSSAGRPRPALCHQAACRFPGAAAARSRSRRCRHGAHLRCSNFWCRFQVLCSAGVAHRHAAPAFHRQGNKRRGRLQPPKQRVLHRMGVHIPSITSRFECLGVEQEISHGRKGGAQQTHSHAIYQ